MPSLDAQSGAPAGGAVVVGNTISMNGSAMVDSFDSTDPLKSSNGLYDPAKRQRNGDIGVLSNVNSDLHNAFVYGDLLYSGSAVKNCTNVQGTVSTPFNTTINPVYDPTWDGFYLGYYGGGNPPTTSFIASGALYGNPTLIKVIGDFTMPRWKELLDCF